MTPEPQSPLRGPAFLKAVRDEENRQAKARRNRRGIWPRKADRPAGAAYKPGMARRMPPPPAENRTEEEGG